MSQPSIGWQIGDGTPPEADLQPRWRHLSAPHSTAHQLQGSSTIHQPEIIRESLAPMCQRDDPMAQTPPARIKRLRRAINRNLVEHAHSFASEGQERTRKEFPPSSRRIGKRSCWKTTRAGIPIGRGQRCALGHHRPTPASRIISSRQAPTVTPPLLCGPGPRSPSLPRLS